MLLQGSYSFKLFKFHDFFHDLRSSSHFPKFSNLFLFQRIFGLNLVQLDINSGVHQSDIKCGPFLLLNFLPLFHIVLVLTSTATYNLPNFHEFPRPIFKFHWLCLFPGLENEILTFNDFPASFITRTNSDTLLNILHSVFFKFKRERNRNNQYCHPIIIIGMIIVIQ